MLKYKFGQGTRKRVDERRPQVRGRHLQPLSEFGQFVGVVGRYVGSSGAEARFPVGDGFRGCEEPVAKEAKVVCRFKVLDVYVYYIGLRDG